MDRSESISENQLPVSGYDTHLAPLRGRLHLGETPNGSSVRPRCAVREGVDPVICSIDEIYVANCLEGKGVARGAVLSPAVDVNCASVAPKDDIENLLRPFNVFGNMGALEAQ